MKIIRKIPDVWQLGRDGLTQSLLSSFLECRKKAELAYKKGYSSSNISNSLVFGSLFHECLDRCYNYMKQGIKEINYENVVNNVLKDHKDQHEGVWTPEHEENHILNEGYIKILLPEYFKRYWKEDSKKEWLAIEKEFRVQYQSEVYLRGKYDRISKSKDGTLTLWDTKTKSRFDPNFQDGLSFNLQAMFYRYAYWKETKQFISNFVFDLVKRPALRKGAMETMKAFMERVKNDVDDDYFQRISVMVTEDEFKQWIGTEFKYMVDGLWQWAIHGPTFKNPTACETRYGVCQFIRTCGLGNFDGLVKREKVFSELTNGGTQ